MIELKDEKSWIGLKSAADKTEPAKIRTRVRKIVGLLIEAEPLQLPLGSRMSIARRDGAAPVPVELVGFGSEAIFLMPFGSMDGIAPGDEVSFETSRQVIWLGEGLLGRVMDGAGDLLDGGPEVARPDSCPLYREAPPALTRKPSAGAFWTGIRAWDAFLTLGLGQRVGIFAGTGVGKSVLLGMIARNCASDVNVLALIGERGHEVNEFIHKVLGEEGMKKTILVVATSDKSPLMRIRAAFTAITVAEYFAAKGKKVLFLMDSITRMAMAARELGLSIGEPPTAKGYPPSVFSMMPKLLERAGNFSSGSITAIISVLLEGDDLQDPIGDATRGILDGHIVLDRALATRGQYPAIEINESLSRWMSNIAEKGHQELAQRCRKVLADYKESEDLINVGAYVSGSNPDIDEAIRLIKPMRKFLKQGVEDRVEPGTVLAELRKVWEQ